MSRTPVSRQIAGFQRGVTLIELMISLVIGLVVLGAMYASYLASSASSASSRAASQVTEDATVAMNLLRTHVGATGYSRPVAAIAATGEMQHAAGDTSSWVNGCDGSVGSFADTSAAIAALTCNTTATAGADSLAVAYEATEANSVTRNVSGEEVPLDCLGNTITRTDIAAGLPGTPGYYLSYSRFFLSGGALHCRGPGAVGSQALVENVAGMQLTYGLANATGGTSAIDYRKANAIAASEWGRVVSVRVCLVVRSEAEVLEEATPYQGCDPFADKLTPDDRRVYRAFTSTIVLYNRTGT